MLVHSDNGPQYTSTEFRKFSKEWCFEQTASLPHITWSNGKAVKTVKKILKTAKDPMEWRASPNRDFASPSKRLFSRKIKTKRVACGAYRPNAHLLDIIMHYNINIIIILHY